LKDPNRFQRLLGRIKAGRFDSLWYSFWVRLRGLDLRPASVEDLGLSANRSKGHASSGGADFVRVLKTIPIISGDRAIDMGSGKGGAVFSLARFPFVEVVGVELSEKLVRIAEANTARLKINNVGFKCADAGRFADLDQYTHVYMFNSFPAEVAKEVLANLEISLIRRPRQLFLIIKGPDSLERIIKSELFKLRSKHSFAYSQPFYVYEHKTLQV
jgi:16S rRNA G527 N7-methylase RsmG